MDKVREEFEKWASKSINPNSGAFFSIKRNGGFYFNQDTHVAWVSWQRSRAALFVELPDHVNDMDSAPMLYDSIVEQLNALGVRYE